MKPAVAQGHKCVTVDALHTRKLNIYLNLYFHFLRSGVEAKSSVEFRHSTRNITRIWQKMGNSAYLLCLVWDTSCEVDRPKSRNFIYTYNM